MRLSEYLKSKSITAAEFARQIGAKSRATVHRYISDEFSNRVPHPRMMQRIVEVTNGAVSPIDFYDLPKPATTSKAAERKAKRK